MATAEIIFGPKHPNCVDLKFWAKSIPISSNGHVAKSLKKAKTKAEAKGAINPANKIAAQLTKARVRDKVVVATTPEETKTATTVAVVITATMTTGVPTTAIAPTMVANPTIQTGKTDVHKPKVAAPILLEPLYQRRKRKNANANVKRLLLARKAKVVAVKANKAKAKIKEETTAAVVVAKVNVRTHKVAAVATITTTIADHSNAPINKAVALEIVLHLKKTMARYLNVR